MKKTLHLLFFLFLVSAHSYSQVAGYMGKRLVVGYSLKFSPAFVGPTSKKTNHMDGYDLFDSDFEFVGINNTHALSLEYTHHRRKALCFTFEYAKTGVDYAYLNESARYDGDRDVPAVLTSFGAGIGIKLFKRANQAPYGPYVKWEGMMLMNKVKYNHTDWSMEDPNDYNLRIKTTQGTGESAFETFAIGFSWGNQRILKDKLVIDRGVRLLVVPASIVASTGSYRTVSAQFESMGIQRIFRHQLINLHVGIGFLAF